MEADQVTFRFEIRPTSRRLLLNLSIDSTYWYIESA
jgi:hypothetical protein